LDRRLIIVPFVFDLAPWHS